MKIFQYCLVWACLLIVSGCGYQWVGCNEQKAIAIPYIVGDADGSFTDELIYQCSQSVNLVVSPDAPYVLEVKIVQDSVEPLGYRCDPQEINGKIRKHLTQNEARRAVAVEASIVDRHKHQPILGPLRISAEVGYDYIDGDSLPDLQFLPNNAPKDSPMIYVLPFSLGQLEPPEAANEAAQRPLYQKLSRKIIDAVGAQW